MRTKAPSDISKRFSRRSSLSRSNCPRSSRIEGSAAIWANTTSLEMASPSERAASSIRVRVTILSMERSSRPILRASSAVTLPPSIGSSASSSRLNSALTSPAEYLVSPTTMAGAVPKAALRMSPTPQPTKASVSSASKSLTIQVLAAWRKTSSIVGVRPGRGGDE